MFKMDECVSIIEKRRKEYGMTIKALSEKSGIRETVLYNILGRKRKMSASELLAVSMVLHLNLDDFQTDKEIKALPIPGQVQG